MKVSPDQIMRVCNATTRSMGRSTFFSAITTDSRKVRKGDLFFALTGPRFDGHNFVTQAYQKGASGAVVCKGRRVRGRKGRWLFAVDDTLWALGSTAADWRRQFTIPVIGITGSNGKTTTKEWIANVLATRYRVLKNEGNYNNLIGLPLSVARLTRRHQIAVFEMGMNAPGEIDRLAEIAAPEVGVITNIARAHLEGLYSLAGVARAKGELIARLPKKGCAILNADDERVMKLARKTQASILTYGFSRRALVRGTLLKKDPLRGISMHVQLPKKSFLIRLDLPGKHNASNALAAIAVGHHFQISPTAIARSLRRAGSLWGRMERIELPSGAIVLNDSYNANPDSVLKALETLARINRRYRKLALLGDMLELGSYDSKTHREIGRAAAHAGISELFAIGERAADILRGAEQAGLPRPRRHFCPNLQAASLALRERLKKKDLLLVKGSREMKLETVIMELRK